MYPASYSPSANHVLVTQSEILRLHRRFKQLDKYNTNYLSSDEFLSIPELAMCPLVMRVLTVFDVDNHDRVTFTQFVKNLGVFHPKADRDEKIRFAFKVYVEHQGCVVMMSRYDVQEDQYIAPGELASVLHMLSPGLDDVQLQQIVDKTIMEADSDGDGKLSFAEFKEAFKKIDVTPRMSIRF